MRILNIVTLVLLVIGGLNWGLFGLTQYDFVAALFSGADSLVSRIIYTVIGAAAVWQLMPLFKSFTVGEVAAERGHTHHMA